MPLRRPRLAGALVLTLGVVAPAARAQPADPADPAAPAPDPDTAPSAPPPVAAAPAAAPVDVAAPVMPPPPAAPAAFTWRPFGYLRLKAGVIQNDPNVAFVGRDDGFVLQNARLGVQGDLAARASFAVSIDGAVDERTRVNSPDGKLRVGLRDAFVDLHLVPGAGSGDPDAPPAAGGIDLRAGRFDPVFDPERLYDDTTRPMVDRALESRGVRPTDGWEAPGLPPGRSIGVALRKDPGPVERGVGLGFEVAVQNGADEFAADNDNDLPAVSAAIFARLPRGGAALAAFRWNARTLGDLPFRQDQTDLAGALGLVLAAGPVELAAGAIVVHTIFDTTGGPAQNAYGGHAQAMFRFGARPLAVGYRFAILDPSDLILTDRVMEHTAGAVVAFPAWHLRAQLDVTHVMEQADRDLSNDRVEAALEVDL